MISQYTLVVQNISTKTCNFQFTDSNFLSYLYHAVQEESQLMLQKQQVKESY